MGTIRPDFEIDSKGRVICRSHSNYEEFVRPDMDYFEFNFILDKKLTCKTCLHYKKNDCYFPTKRIDEIEARREKRKTKCVLCGKKIERMFTIIHKTYLNEIYDVEIPLVCCNCYEYLNENDFMRESQKHFLLSLLFIFIGIWSSMILFFLIQVFNWQTFIIFIYLVPWIFITFKQLLQFKRIYISTIKSKKYFKKNKE